MQAPDMVTNTVRGFPTVIVSKTGGQTLYQECAGEATCSGLTATLLEDNLKDRILWRYTNLYVSDPTGVSYTLSLKDVQFSPDRDLVDVYRVLSLNATYIANTLDPVTNKVRTFISYNKGAAWWPIQSPEGQV